MSYNGPLPTEAQLKNHPARSLEITEVPHSVLTRSMLVLTPTGVHPASLFDNLPLKSRLQMNLVAIGSMLKNGFTISKTDRQRFHVFNIWSTGYQHWLTEVVPKLFLFEERIKGGSIIVPEKIPRFVSDFSDIFDIGDMEPLNTNTYFREFSVVSNPNSGHYDPAHIGLIRERFISKLNVVPEPKRRIYVTRRNAWGRKVVNEDEIIPVLEKAGFETVDMENVSLAEQVRLFAECSDLLSIHGAGLTNLIFMPAGARVIELYPAGFGKDDFFNACYHRLSGDAGIDHMYLFCDRANKNSKFDLHHDDIVVDPQRLESLLEEKG